MSQGTPGLPLDTAKEGHPGKVVWYLIRLGPVVNQQQINLKILSEVQIVGI